MSLRSHASRGRAALAASAFLFLLTAACALPARASITPDAQKIVDRYLEASGGRAAWQHTHTMHGVGTLTAFGMKGRIETWRATPDKRASEIQIGPLDIKDWANGGKAWRVDPSGKLLALDGKDLEQAATSTWFDNERWLDPDQGGGSITTLADHTDSLGTRAVLEITPPNGKARLYEFDRKTGLLVRDSFRMDQMQAASTYSDYRKVDGWMVAFRTVQEVAGAAANTAVAQLDSVSFGMSIPDDRFQPAGGAGAAITWLKTPGVARLPFEYLSRHVWLKASVNGGPLENFIFDTGASVTVIDSAYAAKIGLKSSGQMQAQGAGSAGGASFAQLDKLRIQSADGDGVEITDPKVAVLSVNPVLAPFFWRDCAGIIGFDAIVQFVNEVDFDGKMLTLYDPKTFTYSGKGTALPMTLAGTVPVVNLKVDGYEGAARVDVGSGSTLDLHTPFVTKNDLLTKHPKALTVMGGGFGGTFESRFARLRSIEIGPYQVNEPLVGLSTITTGALASEDYAGNIGNHLLDRFKVTLDYDRRKIYLEPGAKYAARETFTRFGAQLAKQQDGAIVAVEVLPKSPAEDAGIQSGDTIVSIDGLAVSSLDPDKIEDRFDLGKPGQKVAVVVKRDGKEKKVTVKLRDLL